MTAADHPASCAISVKDNVMTYRFDIEHRGDGSVRVTCGIYEATGERALARKLVNAGAVDGPIVAGRPGRDDYRVASLHRFAAGMIEEGEKPPFIRVYRPHGKAEVSPALQDAISLLVERTKNRREGFSGIHAPECVEKPLAVAAT